MEKRAQTTLLKQKLGEIKEPACWGWLALVCPRLQHLLPESLISWVQRSVWQRLCFEFDLSEVGSADLKLHFVEG